MNERRDDTTKPGAEKPETGSRPAPGRYYYDDATGYETYRPDTEEDEPEDDEPVREETEPAAGG